jgi:O-antigen ligase
VTRGVDSRACLLIGGVLGLAIGSGVVAAARPTLSLGLTIILLAVLAVAYVRTLVRHTGAPLPGRLASASTGPRVTSGESALAPYENSRGDGQPGEKDNEFRFARILYYLGLLFIGQLTLRRGASVTLSDVFFLLSFLITTSTLALQRRRVDLRLPGLLLAGIFLFVVGGLISSFDAEAPRQSILVLMKLAYVTVIWFWLGTVILRRRGHVLIAIVLWVMSAALDGVGAIAQRLAGQVILGGEVNWGRMTGFTANVNDLGGVTCIALVPALMLMISVSKRSTTMFLSGLGLMLVTAGLVLSGSVGSLVAAAVALTLWFGSHPTRLQRLLALVAAFVALAALYSAQNSPESQSVVQRITRFGTGSPDDPDRTLGSRLDTYRAALDRIAANPFIGVGLDTETQPATEHPVHNIVIGSWFQAGILGLTGMFFIFLAGLKTARSAILAAQSFDERALAVGLTAAFAAFVTFLMSEPALFTRYGWVTVALLIALRATQVASPHPSRNPAPAYPGLAQSRSALA